jgi:hypothetical protein
MEEDILRGMSVHAAGLQRLIHDIQRQMPGTVEAADPSGAVQVKLDAAGLPASFEVDEGWTRSLHPTALGAAVVAAFTAATRRRFTVSAQILENIDLSAADEPRQPAAVQHFQPPGPPHTSAPPRDVGEFLREVLDITADIDAITEPRVLQATGSAASGMLTLTIGSDATLSCSADQAWASDKTGAELTAALNTALAAARRELAEAADAAPTARASRLLDEAVAVLKGQTP